MQVFGQLFVFLERIRLIIDACGGIQFCKLCQKNAHNQICFYQNRYNLLIYNRLSNIFASTLPLLYHYFASTLPLPNCLILHLLSVLFHTFIYTRLLPWYYISPKFSREFLHYIPTNHYSLVSKPQNSRENFILNYHLRTQKPVIK